MQKHLLAIAVILTAATGCDNVAWGGVDMELRPPPAPEPDSTLLVDSLSLAPENIDGPLLFAGVRDSLGARAVLVGEALSDGLMPFPDPAFPEDSVRLAELTSTGSTLILFSGGVRIGRMTAQNAVPALAYCGNRVEVTGPVELVPNAAGAQRFLALTGDEAHGAPYETFVPIEHDYDQRVATLDLANEALIRYEARRPTSILDARRDVNAIQLAGMNGQTVAATFLYEDQLRVGPPTGNAWALFVLGQAEGGSYADVFTWYRSVDTEGKGAPRYFDHLDWDGDGQEEILLDVLGTNRQWFAALSPGDSAWVRSFQDSCGSGAGAVLGGP